METLWKDVHFALRTFRRTPGVAAAAIVALALGIGANTAIFSVVDGVLLRPLPYPDSARLVAINGSYPALGRERTALSWLEYKDLAAWSRTLANVAVWAGSDANLTAPSGPPERVSVGLASSTLLPTLGVQPLLGRNFVADEERQGNDHVAMLDFATWRDRFGSDAGVLGHTVVLDNLPHRIVGVLPRDFTVGDARNDVWIPLSTSMPEVQERGSHWLRGVGRTRPGVAPAVLAADLDAMARRMSEADPQHYGGGWRLVARPLLEHVVGDVRLALLVLLGAVAFVLLIACANVANLMLARAASRRREMAVRTALGAGRGRLIRQLLTESLLLSFTGAALGVGIAAWAVDGLVALAPDALPRAREVGVDGRVLAFTVALALVTGIAFGLAPALSASRPDLHEGLRDGARGASSTRGRLRRTLVVAELALSLVLLAGTGLLLRSFIMLRAVDSGLRPEHVLTLRAALPAPKGEPTNDDRARWVAWFERATERLRQLPAVRAAGAADILPFDGNDSRYTFEIEGEPPRAPIDLPHEEVHQIMPGYFEALGIPLVRGRLFAGTDGSGAPPVVVINRALARRYWPGDGDAVGKRIKLHAGAAPGWSTVVGVVGDVRGFGLDQPAHPEMYVPYAQTREGSALALVVRGDGDAAALAGVTRAALAELDAAQPIFDVKPMTELVAASLAQRRFAVLLMLLFAGVALLLAAVGIYSVTSYTLAQRTQELGIRVALGATPRAILAMLLGDSLALVALGLGIGLVAAVLVTRLLGGMLYGVAATDLATYAVIAGLLGGVALVATVIPARRATRVDPMLALRAD